MSSRFSRSVHLCAMALAVFSSSVIPLHAADVTLKVGFWNVRAGKGVAGLAGHAAPYVDTANCTDPSQPLNAWGTGAMQAEMRSALADPSVIALGLAESWGNMCGSPENVRQALGWQSATGEQNGVALVARYGFAGPEQWQQLDTSLNTTPGDTMWIVRAPVCLDAACTKSMPVYVAHWYGTGANGAAMYDKQAQQTTAFLAATAQGLPHIVIGDLNVWEGSSKVCNQNPQNTSLGYMRGAGYLDAWLTVNGGAEGFTGMINRAGCGVPEGYAWKRIDYAWTPASVTPTAMSRFGIVPAGDAAPSDHYGVVVTVTVPGMSTTTTTGTGTGTGTTGTTNPPPTTNPPTTTSANANGDIILFAKQARVVGSAWAAVADTTAAGGVRLANADAGVAKLGAASAAPASYIELPFTAEPGRAYRLWIRGRAQGDSWQNDSTFVQFSGSLDASGAPAFRINTTAATVVSVEEGSGAGVSGWGWSDNGYGTVGQAIYFDTAAQTLRIQVREDGLSFDQIVLSPVTYFTAAPGATKNDVTILVAPTATATSGAVTWTNTVHASANGSFLAKTGGCADCPDAGAVSTQTVGLDGALTFGVAIGERLVVGLNTDTTTSTSYAIAYSFSFSGNGTFELREAGRYIGEGPQADGDVFKIAVVNGTVRYYRNDVLVGTSKTPVTAPLVADASLTTATASVTSAAITR